ncbi:MAG: choice-of-anchor D domain-containing protein [Calditrichaeota bacterium]|nr:MAG: choice-of-anchor D domain-containing protein [Calditrichota bacterium]
MKKILLFLILGLCNLVFANDGDLDLTFNGDGIAAQNLRTTGLEELSEFKILPDGSIIAIGKTMGEITIVKLDSMGNKINSFGLNNQGFTNITLAGYNLVFVNALESQLDGKIVFGGEMTYAGIINAFLVRLNIDGTFDNNFGSPSWPIGIILENFNMYKQKYNDIKILPNGKILCVGSCGQTNAYSDEDILIARYNSDGTLDNTFGDNGKIIYDHMGDMDSAVQIEILDNGEIIIFAAIFIQGFGLNTSVLKINDDGSFDDSFGVNGIIFTNVKTKSNLVNWNPVFLLEEDEKFTFVGKKDNELGVFRFHLNGKPDLNFASNGIFSLDNSLFWNNNFYDVDVTKDSKIVFSGGNKSEPPPIGTNTTEFFLFKMDYYGSIDSSFGNSGSKFLDIAGNDERIISTHVLQNGKILTGGFAQPQQFSNPKFTFARFENSFDLQSPVIESKMVKFDSTFTGNSNSAFLKIKNTGFGNLVVNNFIISSPFAFNPNFNLQIPFTIAPSDSVNIELDFYPALVGNNFGTLTIFSNTGMLYDVALEGFGIGSVISNSDSLDFGLAKAEWGEEVEKTVTLPIENLGNSVLEIYSLNFTNPVNAKFNSDASLPIQIQPNSIYNLPVKFGTNITGDFVGSLEITTNDFLQNTKTVALTAMSGFYYPSISVQSDTINFGNIILNQGQAAIGYDFVNIFNSGDGILKITDLSLSGQNFSNFIFNESLPIILQPSESYGIGITFTSLNLGSFEANLEIVSNDLVNSNEFVNLFAEVVLTDSKESSNSVPKDFTLLPNYPNPFNPSTKITFGIPEKSSVRLEIFNVLGQKVKTLVEAELLPSFYTFEWNGTDEFNNRVSNGIYLLKMQAGKFTETRKMTILK